jgi:hypothetical protein
VDDVLTCPLFEFGGRADAGHALRDARPFRAAMCSLIKDDTRRDHHAALQRHPGAPVPDWWTQIGPSGPNFTNMPNLDFCALFGPDTATASPCMDPIQTRILLMSPLRILGGRALRPGRARDAGWPDTTP